MENWRAQVLKRMFFSQGHAADVFEAYTQLLTEMVLRLPYQIKKIADTNSRIPPPVFDHSWFYFLSEVSVREGAQPHWRLWPCVTISSGGVLPLLSFQNVVLPPELAV